MAQPFPAVLVPHQIANMPNNSRYVVAYDFNTNPIQNAPPDGWGKHRAFLYGRIVDNLQQNAFTQDQYSVWAVDNADPAVAYTSMIDLSRTQDLPIGMVSTTIKGLMVLHQPHENVMDVTNSVQLGGAHTPANPQNAIIPTGLVPPVLAHLYGPAGNIPPPIGRARFVGQPQDYSTPL